MNPIPMLRALLPLLAAFALNGSLRAESAEMAFLLHPEIALTGTSPATDQPTLAPRVDGSSLDFTAPQILIYKNTHQAEFISAVWKDASGQPTHQRAVLLIKPDYGVIVDYLFGSGRHAISRGLALPSGIVTSDTNGAQSALPGSTIRLQAIDPEINAVTDGNIVKFSSTVQAPSPIPTVFLAWAGAAPLIESIKPANPMVVKFNVTFPGGRVDQVAVAWEPRPLHLGSHEFNGWAACLRTGPARTSVSIAIH